MDSKLAAILMGADKREPTKFQRKASLRANELAYSMNIPKNARYRQQMMGIAEPIGGTTITGRYAIPGQLPGMERLIDALDLAERTMQRNRGERQRSEGLPALHGK